MKERRAFCIAFAADGKDKEMFVCTGCGARRKTPEKSLSFPGYACRVKGTKRFDCLLS